MPFQPRKIFLDLRGIDDEQKFRLADSIKNQIINDAAVIIEEKSVLPLTDVQLRYIIGQHAVEPVTRIIPRDDELSHVRNIEHADGFSHGLMFIHDAGVLHRHEPAAEWDHSCAEPPVFLVKRRLFLGGFAHASILDFEESDASMHPNAGLKVGVPLRVATLKTQTAPLLSRKYDVARQTRTAHRVSRRSRLAPLRRLSYRARLRPRESESGLSSIARSRSCCRHARRSLAADYLHFHSANGEHAAITRLG